VQPIGEEDDDVTISEPNEPVEQTDSTQSIVDHLESHAIVKLTLEHIAPAEFKPDNENKISTVSGGMKPLLGKTILSYASFVSTLVGFELPSVVNGFMDVFPQFYSYTVAFPMNSAIQNHVDSIVTTILNSKTLESELIANFI